MMIDDYNVFSLSTVRLDYFLRALGRLSSGGYLYSKRCVWRIGFK
jgi:hypothetical protein